MQRLTTYFISFANTVLFSVLFALIGRGLCVSPVEAATLPKAMTPVTIVESASGSSVLITGEAFVPNPRTSGEAPGYRRPPLSGAPPAGLSLESAGTLDSISTSYQLIPITIAVNNFNSPVLTQTKTLTLRTFTKTASPKRTEDRSPSTPVAHKKAPQAPVVHYLSALGNDGNDGLTPQTAWWSPNHSGLTCGVDTIIAEPSSTYGILGYTQFYADWGKVNCSGGDNVVWLKCAEAFACKDINRPLGFTVNESFWGVSGFEVDSSQYPGFAAASSGATIHHIIFANNICKDCGGGGFTTFNSGNYGVDYVNIIGNIVYNSANSAGVCGSGISIAAPAQSDTAQGTHIYVAGNFSIANMNPARCAGTAATDGNGLIFDTFNALSYKMQVVAANNLLIGNGGRGLEILNGTAPTYTFNNTMWGNNTDSSQSTTWAGEYLVALANHVTSLLDLASTSTGTAYGGKPLSAFYLVGTDPTTSLSNDWANAISKVDINLVSGVGLFRNVTGVNPVFLNPSVPAEPVCDASPNTVACMEVVIANFTPRNSSAKRYGYQRPYVKPVMDSLFPHWLCGANIPSGLITLGCL